MGGKGASQAWHLAEEEEEEEEEEEGRPEVSLSFVCFLWGVDFAGFNI